MAILVTSLLLLIFFKSLKVVLISIVVVLIGVVWSVGIIGLFGYELTALMALIPPLVIVIGIPNCIYLINKYQQEFRKNNDKIKSLELIIQKVGNATFLTNATTALGFGTFVFTSSKMMIEFGSFPFGHDKKHIQNRKQYICIKLLFAGEWEKVFPNVHYQSLCGGPLLAIPQTVRACWCVVSYSL